MSGDNHQPQEQQGNHNGQNFSVSQEKKLEIALENRKLELNFFWQRSAAFWVFNAAALAGLQYFSSKDEIVITIGISFLGFIAALTWSLVNRGSKFWYEHWENKIFEDQELKDWFDPGIASKPIKEGFYCRRFSPSRLLIVLSDHVTVAWFFILTVQIWKNSSELIDALKDYVGYLFSDFLPIISFLAFILYIFIFIKFTYSRTRSVAVDPPEKVLKKMAKSLSERDFQSLRKLQSEVNEEEIKNSLKTEFPKGNSKKLEKIKVKKLDSVEITVEAELVYTWKSAPTTKETKKYRFVFEEGKWVCQDQIIPRKPSC